MLIKRIFCSFILSLAFISAYAASKTNGLIVPQSVNTPGGSNLGYTLSNGVKVFRLEASPVTKTIFDSKLNVIEKHVSPKNAYTGPTLPQPLKKQVANGFGYNGSIPGPTIIVNQGDRIQIIFKNNLSQPTSIHWHGIVLPNSQDGAGGVDEPVVMPGETRTYAFPVVNQPGTYAYHSGFNDTKQVISGLRGAFIILPKEGDDVKDDFVIMLQGWPMLGDGSKTINAMSMDNKFFTFNGLAAPNFPVLQIPYGHRVRIRFVNMSSNVPHPIHLHGYNFMITGTEGGPIQRSAQWPASTMAVSPGETRNIEFIANNPGIWRLHCHILHHIVNDVGSYTGREGILPEGGMYTYVIVGKAKAGVDLSRAYPWVKAAAKQRP